MKKQKTIHLKMEATGLFVLVLFIVLILVELPLAARERRGSMVEVTLADGIQFKGELLAVKDDVLVVFDHGADQGRSLDLRQVREVKVLKKSRFFDGAGIGLCVGLALSIGNLRKLELGHGNLANEAARSFLPLPFMFCLGGLAGALVSIPERLPLNGEFLEKNQLNLEHLKRHARERDPE